MRVHIDIELPNLPKRRPLRVAAVLVLSLALLVPSVVLASHLFADVPDSNAFHGNITALAESGVTAGCGGSNYCPKDSVTREQMAAFLNRGLGRVTRSDHDGVVPTTATSPFDTFTITPGIPNGALAGATMFIKADATISVALTNASGCPCKYAAWLFLRGVGEMAAYQTDITLDYVDQVLAMPLTGALGVTGSAEQTIDVYLYRYAGAGSAVAIVTATAMVVPFGGDGGNDL